MFTSCQAAHWMLAGLAAVGVAAGCGAEPAYHMADFAQVRKFDAHVHANTPDTALLDQARLDNFEVLSINVDYPDFPPLAVQAQVAKDLSHRDAGRFHYATTFAMQGWSTPGWSDRVNATLRQAVADGAVAVKIWKNVGMVERDARGRYLAIDDPVFDPVIAQVQALNVPLIAHQGEPYNCWLPLEEMTTDNDRSYFTEHPQYHMYLHPELPGYEALMAARDRFVERHPALVFVGAHLASLEWDVDRLARFLDGHPNAVVDMAARMTQLQYQSVRNRQHVRDFLIRYQDRVLYGTDLTADPASRPAEMRREAHAFWRSDWQYLATPDSQWVQSIHAKVAGLALPRSVTRKLYYDNAARIFLHRD